MSQYDYTMRRSEYPDPFLDVASTKLPKSRQKLLELCYQFATTHPQFAPIVKKLARYPITRMIFDSDDSHPSSFQEWWRDVLENKVEIAYESQAAGMDYFGYGICVTTVHRPFLRKYTCTTCEKVYEAGQINYFIRNKGFWGRCEACGSDTKLEAEDAYITNPNRINVVRHAPQNLYIRYIRETGDSDIYCDVSESLKQAVRKSRKPDRRTIDQTPIKFVKAAMEDNARVRFDRNRVHVMRQPTLSGRNMAWGMPTVMAGMKEAYLNQVYKKADESSANERVLPARFVYPQGTTQDPLSMISLSKWQQFMGESMARWRQDKNAVIPSAFPVGVAEVGGDAQRFNTANLRQLSIKEIIGSTGVPEGFLADGMTWSGGSVQLRMLENMLMSYMRQLNTLLQFVIDQVAQITGKPRIKAEWKPFRMADDVQKLQMLIQLAQMKVVSYKEVLDRMDLSFDKQYTQVRKETEKLSEVQIEEQLVGAKAALRSAEVQSETQIRQQGYQSLTEEMSQDDSAADMHFRREGGIFPEIDDQQEQEASEQAQQEAQLQERAQMAEIQGEEAKAMKERAVAEQKGVHADIAEESVQAAPIIESLVNRMRDLSPEEQGAKLEEMRQQGRPAVANAVEERLAEQQQRDAAQTPPEAREGREQGEQMAEQQAEQQPEPTIPQIVEHLRDQSRNVDEFADRLMMRPPEIRQPALEFLRETDPMTHVRVLQKISLINPPNNRGGGQAGQVSMSPQNPVQPPQG